MAISEENKDKLKQIDRGISFPVNSDGNAIDEVGAFNIEAGVDSDLKWSAKETDAALLGTGTIIGCKLLSVDLLDSEITTTTGTQFVTLGGRYGFSTFSNITYSFKNPTTNLIVSKAGFPLTTDPNIKNLTEFSIDPKSNQDVNYTVEFIVEFDYSEVANQSVDELQFDGGEGTGTGITLLLESSTEANPARLLLESSTRTEDYGEGNFSVEDGDFVIQTTVDDDGNFLLFVDEVEQKAYRKDVFTFNQTVRNFTGEKIGEIFRAAIAGEPTPSILSAAGEAQPGAPEPDDDADSDFLPTVEEEEIEEVIEEIEIEEVVVESDVPAEFVYIDSQGNILIDSSGVTLKGSNLNDTPIQINNKLESIT